MFESNRGKKENKKYFSEVKYSTSNTSNVCVLSFGRRKNRKEIKYLFFLRNKKNKIIRK